MAEFLTIVIVASLGFLILVQGAIVHWYARCVRQAVDREPDRTFQPPLAIVLSLRGTDPFLTQCIESLLSQEYGDFEVFCVFDNADDPARRLISPFESRNQVAVVIADEHRKSCSLKCNSLVTVIESLEARYEIVVLVDSDTLVDRHWLSDLVAPLSGSDVVASSGNRWYTPEDRAAGTMVRYLWNLAAAPQMLLYKIPWGGSLAVRLDFVRESDLLKTWCRSLFEDTVINREARRMDKQVVTVPDLLIPNRESVSLPNVFRWMRRQLLDIRLYHHSFPLAATHCFGSGVILMAAGVLLLANFLAGQWAMSAWLLSGLLAYGGFWLTSLLLLESSARKALDSRRDDCPPRLSIRWLTPWHVILTQMVYTLATISAMASRRARWRGVEYRIRQSNSIEMVEYRQMSQPESVSENGVSIES